MAQPSTNNAFPFSGIMNLGTGKVNRAPTKEEQEAKLKAILNAKKRAAAAPSTVGTATATTSTQGSKGRKSRRQALRKNRRTNKSRKNRRAH